MKLFEEAFLKAGLVSSDQLQAKQAQEKAELERQQALQAKEQEEKQLHLNKQEGLYGHFDALFSSKQKFVLHLIHAFIPTVKVIPWEPNQSKDCKCCICSTPLISQLEILEKILEKKLEILEKSGDASQVMVEDICRSVGNNPMMPEERTEKYKKIFGDRKLGVMSNESTAVFCKPCIQTFVEWVFVSAFRHHAVRRTIQYLGVAGKK
jgi:hypothetical protein